MHKQSVRRVRRSFWGICILPLLVLSVAASSVGAYVMEDDFHVLTEEYVSPHIAWAKPNAGGPVRALFIVPRGTAREVIEVAQRLQLEYEYVMTLSDKELGWTADSGPYAPAEGASYEQMAGILREKLTHDYDVIITGHLEWAMFPRDILYTIMTKIQGGTGLVHSYADYGRNELVERLFTKAKVEAPFISAGVPWQSLPVWRDMDIDTIVESRVFGQGRMALLTHGARPKFMFLTPAPSDADDTYRELHYEYYQSLALKAILWAARREPAVQFASIGLGVESIDRLALPDRPLVAALRGAPEAMAARLVLRDEDGREYVTLDGRTAQNNVAFNLPRVPAGEYFADVWLHTDEGTVNWASTHFTVTSSPAIAEVSLDIEHAQPGDTVNVEVRLTGGAPAGSQVRLEAIDNHGRLVARIAEPLQAGQQRVSLAVRVSNPLALSQDLWVSLEADDEVMDRAMTHLYVPFQRSRGNYASMVWAADRHVNEFVRRIMWRQLRKMDVDTFTNSSLNPNIQAWTARYNFDTIPYATRYSYDGSDPIRKPCLSDPTFIEQQMQYLEKVGRDLGPFAPRAYTLGDECFLARRNVDVCFSPSCQADFRQWLQTEYDGIAALNESWGTAYASFDEVEKINFDDAKAAGEDHASRWVDHRRHMEYVYARIMELSNEAIKRGDPNAEVGFDGPFDTDSYSGNDWWRLMSTFDICNVYFHQPTQWEFLRSFSKPGMLLGLWYGGYFEHRNEDQARLWAWKGILNGFNSMWWYAVYHGLSVCPMDALTPSMTIYPTFQQATEEMQYLQGGPGNALLAAERQHDGIAVHYSQSSLHASTWDGDWGRLDRVWRQAFAVLEDMGLQFDCRAYAEIEEDGLDPAEYPVFIMPYSQAVSPREAAVIREYVANGGMVLADVRPAVRDHHGKLQEPGMLDDLFGIRRVAGEGIQVQREGHIAGTFEGFNVQAHLLNLSVDSDVEVTDATALGASDDIPLVIVKRTGRGLTVLLNYGFAAPFGQRNTANGLEHWAVLHGLLSLNGVTPVFSISAEGEPLRQLETVRFADGRVNYLGFLKYRADGKEATVTATVRSTEMPLHTYNMRTGQYHGQVSSWQTPFVPSRGTLFARVPYSVDGITVSAGLAPAPEGPQESAPMARVAVSLQCSDTPGRHWVNVRFYRPDGEHVRPYMRNISVENGSGSVYVPLALNDMSGEWRIVARDAVSSKTAETTIRLP